MLTKPQRPDPALLTVLLWAGTREVFQEMSYNPVIRFHGRETSILPLLRELSAGLAKYGWAYDCAKTTRIVTMPIPTGQLTISLDFGSQHVHDHLSWQWQPFVICRLWSFRAQIKAVPRTQLSLHPGIPQNLSSPEWWHNAITAHTFLSRRTRSTYSFSRTSWSTCWSP